MRLIVGAAVGAVALALAGAPVMAAPAATGSPATAALLPITQVLFEMDEAPGATTMLDSSGHGLSAPIDQSGLDTGVVDDGATGYLWPFRPPNLPPPSPERIIQVADDPLLDPLGDTFTVEVRYRTKEKFGNIIQKGQSASRGGQWKIQNPLGKPSCLFKDSFGRRTSTRSRVALNDNAWHTLTCVRTTSSVTMYVDGAYMNRQVGTTGTIDNTIPMTVAGKINCDQVEITCDYFSGMIDYVRITRGS